MESSLGTITDLLQYFNLNKQIFQKEKNNKQHMQRVMAMLTQQNMKILEKQFQLYTKGLELPTFIYLMKKLYIPQSQLSKYYFVSDLIKFFQAIDINGDGHLEWSQFTQYIIQNIRRVQKPNYKNKSFQQNQIISSAYSKISNEYKITRVIDTGASNCIKKITYLSKQKKYYVLEAGSNGIKVYDSEWKSVQQFKLKGQSQTSYIIDFSIDQKNQIFCALFQGSARFCNIKLSGAIKFMNQVEQKKLKNYHKVQYLANHQLWAFLSKTGDIKYSSIIYKSRTQMTYTCQLTLHQHQALITDILQIQEPKYILTSSMDGTIKLFSKMLCKSLLFQHISEETTSCIAPKNKKGVLGIDYTREFGSYILGYGFSTKIYIYSLDISLTKGYIGKYSEHSGNLISARFLKCYPYVLSFDDKLNLRIWDFRTFQTMQIINCQKNFINPSRLQIIPELSQCLICQKKITQLRAPSFQKKSKQINEFYSIFDFKICSMTNNIFVFTSNDVRVYNYITGALMHVFTKLDQNQFETNITAAQFGYKSRKFFLGDAAGYVRQFDSQTGEFLQEIRPEQDIQYQNKSIVKIMFLKEHSLLIVCTLDGRIMIYERNSESEFQIIRDIRQSHQQLICAGASVRYCLLATGGENGTVNIWSLQKFALQTVLVVRNKVTAVGFSPIHPIMIVVEETGVMSFFYVKPFENSHLRYKCFLKIENRDQSNLLQQICSFSFDLIIKAYFNPKCSLIQDISSSKHHFIITIGQKNGQIVEANLNLMIQKFKIQQNHQIFSTKKSIRCQIQSAKTLISNQRNKILTLQGYSNENVEVMTISEFYNVKKFYAHGSQISQLLLIKENSIILTTSTDKKLKVFSLEGELNGSIDFFTFKKINWRVSQINFHKKIQAIETCIYAIKLIQNRRFTKKEEDEIKINLLMNEFMNEKQKQDYLSWIKVIRRNRYPKIRCRQVKVNTQNGEKGGKNKRQRDSSSQDQEILEEYFRSIRVNNGEGNQENLQSNMNGVESISSNEFNQIYKKLASKIKKKLQEDQNNNTKLPQFSNIDINNLLSKPKKAQKQQIQKQYTLNSQNNKAISALQSQLNNIASSTLLPNKKLQQHVSISPHPLTILKEDRIITTKQNKQYQQLFNRTLTASSSAKWYEDKKQNVVNGIYRQHPYSSQIKNRKGKGEKLNKKGNIKQKNERNRLQITMNGSNILYHNLTQVRRKIDVMKKMVGKGSLSSVK